MAGETVYHVPTLSVPDPNKTIELGSLQQHEAVRLFIDRAAASRRGFGLTEQNAAAIVQICHRLDGIPLAIELAAARVRALSVETIAVRLNDRFCLARDRASDGIAASTHSARADRLELRPADRRRAHAVSAFVGLRGRLDARSRPRPLAPGVRCSRTRCWTC